MARSSGTTPLFPGFNDLPLQFPPAAPAQGKVDVSVTARGTGEGVPGTAPSTQSSSSTMSQVAATTDTGVEVARQAALVERPEATTQAPVTVVPPAVEAVNATVTARDATHNGKERAPKRSRSSCANKAGKAGPSTPRVKAFRAERSKTHGAVTVWLPRALKQRLRAKFGSKGVGPWVERVAEEAGKTL